MKEKGEAHDTSVLVSIHRSYGTCLRCRCTGKRENKVSKGLDKPKIDVIMALTIERESTRTPIKGVSVR